MISKEIMKLNGKTIKNSTNCETKQEKATHKN